MTVSFLENQKLTLHESFFITHFTQAKTLQKDFLSDQMIAADLPWFTKCVIWADVLI